MRGWSRSLMHFISSVLGISQISHFLWSQQSSKSLGQQDQLGPYVLFDEQACPGSQK